MTQQQKAVKQNPLADVSAEKAAPTVVASPSRKSPIEFVRQSKAVRIGLLAFVIIGIIAGLAYYSVASSRVYVEKAEIIAPIISIAPATTGILDKIRVQEGEHIVRGQVLAVLEQETLRSKTEGIVVAVQDTPGQIITSQTPIVKLVDPAQLRVIGHVEEDKGLRDIKAGQRVVFQVDAYGSKQYVGQVETVMPTSHQSDIVFSISDKRELRQFDVKVKFDVGAYPELKNGMSAKMWVYK